jgi:hypothetical protein
MPENNIEDDRKKLDDMLVAPDITKTPAYLIRQTRTILEKLINNPTNPNHSQKTN